MSQTEEMNTWSIVFFLWFAGLSIYFVIFKNTLVLSFVRTPDNNVIIMLPLRSKASDAIQREHFLTEVK